MTNNIIHKKDMNLIIDSSIALQEPTLYECLNAAWDNSSTGLTNVHLEKVQSRFPNEVEIIMNTAKFIKEKYVDSEWRVNSYIAEIGTGICERCGANLKYRFKISNISNNITKTVGSECLIHFGSLDTAMNLEAYNLLIQKYSDYESKKSEIEKYFKHKSYPYPSFIISTTKNPFSLLQKAEDKLRKFTVHAENEVDKIIDVIEELLILKNKLESHHNKYMYYEFYCDTDIYNEISSDKNKVRLVELNNSIINRVIANELKSKKFFEKYREKIENALNISKISMNKNSISFETKNLKVVVRSSELHRIFNSIIFTNNYDRKKFQNISVEIDKKSLFSHFGDIANEFIQEQMFSKVDFDFIEDEYFDLIRKGSKYIEYNNEYLTKLTLHDMSTCVNVIESIRNQLERVPKDTWFDEKKLNEMRSNRKTMEERPHQYS